jgi:hypothetical protein
MRQVQVTVNIGVPDDCESTDEEIASLVGDMLEVGQADAVETSQDEDLDNPEADLIAVFEVGTPFVKE